MANTKKSGTKKKAPAKTKQETPSEATEAPESVENEETVEVPSTSAKNTQTKPSLEERLEKLEKENEMLKAVADKARVYNYENKTVGKKQMVIKLSQHEDKILVGWRTLKDVLVKNPTTGLTVGEQQEYELLLLDKDGNLDKVKINGYNRFSEIRYTDRIEARVVGKKEDEEGKVSFTVLLPDGREIDLESRFIN